jgi:hypothetical protein
MSEMTGADPAGAGSAAGGTPSESDLPAMQGLGESVDDPSDPTASRRDADEQGPAGMPDLSGADEDGPSDPMPDMSGTTGS